MMYPRGNVLMQPYAGGRSQVQVRYLSPSPHGQVVVGQLPPQMYVPVSMPPALGFAPPSYLVQPMQVLRRHPQQEINLNFDYQSANFLCEAKIVENTIYCVVCKSEYTTSQKEEHIQKHARTTSKPLQGKVCSLPAPLAARTYLIKPIVEPEEFNIQYQPTVYNLVRETHFEDESMPEKCHALIGDENSFSMYNLNTTLPHSVHLPDDNVRRQPNPFIQNPAVLPKDIVVSEIQNEGEARQLKAQVEQHAPSFRSSGFKPQAEVIGMEEPQMASFRKQPVSLHNSVAQQAPHEATFQRDQRQSYHDFTQFAPQMGSLYRGPVDQLSSFSGPIEIKGPLNERSKKETENIAQLLREFGGEAEGEERRRLPTRVEW